MNVTARPRSGLVLQGGFNTAKTDSDYCEVRSAIPEWTVLGAQSPTNPWCDTSTGWVTRVTGLGTYTIPKIDVLVAGTFRSDQGVVAGRELGGAQLGDRRAQSPVCRRGWDDGHGQPDRARHALWRSRQPVRHAVREDPALRAHACQRRRSTSTTSPNSAPVLSYNQTFVRRTVAWLAPTSVLQPRFVKFSAQIDF